MKPSRQIIIIAHDIRSTHNIGSLLRTAEGLGVSHLALSGYTPYPEHTNDERLPHLAKKIHAAIKKTALGAETMQSWSYEPDLPKYIEKLRSEDYGIFALEQTSLAVSLPNFQPPQKLVILLGREVEGIAPDILTLCDGSIEIPMKGKKESFNVVQAAAMALYHCTFCP